MCNIEDKYLYKSAYQSAFTQMCDYEYIRQFCKTSKTLLHNRLNKILDRSRTK